MSNKVSVLVYSRRFGSPVRKAVMVYFAERASDDGAGVWASKATIASAIECGRSTVIRTIKEFVSEGLLTEVGTRPCRNGETVEYCIELDAVSALEEVGLVPKRDRSRSWTSPAAGHDPSRSGTPTSPAAGPKPSYRTIKEPSDKSSARNSLCEVAGPDAVDSFLKFRKQLRKPVTPTAATRLAKVLSEITANGGDADDALGLCEERGWQAIKADWYFREKGTANGFGTHHAGPSSHAAGRGQGTSLASIVARRRLASQG